MKDYSQSGEQIAILAAFKDHDPKRFLDVGAWNAEVFSNTRALYELGWEGVMIEPSPVPMQSLLRAYGKDPRVRLVCAAVGPDNHLAELHVTNDALSTTSAHNYLKWSELDGGFYGTMLIPQITWMDIFRRFEAGFSFINIDTEGTSVELLKKLLETEVRPRCICFEHDHRHVESFQAFSKAGYRIVLENDDNRVIVRD